ncbi:STM3941 family protein [Ferruginibacter sp.]
MNPVHTIEISLSKKKILRFLISGIFFLGCGIWMIASQKTGNRSFGDLLLQFIAWGGIALGLFCVYIYPKQLFNKKPGLVISEEGIYDNITAAKFGLILWPDIEAIFETAFPLQASTQYFITISLFDPEKYIARQKNTLKRKLLLANAKKYGSPVCISVHELNISHTELLQLLNAAFEKYQQSRLDTIVGHNSQQ